MKGITRYNSDLQSSPYFERSGSGFDLFFYHCTVYNLVNLRPYTDFSELIGIRAVDPVRQKYICQLIFWIYPETGAGKAGMPIGFGGGRQGWIWLLPCCIIFFRLIKPISPATYSALVCSKQFNGFFFEKLVTIIRPVV